MMLMTSIPDNVRWADSNSLKPVVIVILRFICRWSCSTILFKYLTLLILIFFSEIHRLFTVRIPAVFAPLLSILIILGLPLFPIALFKNFCAEPFILHLVSKKSIVFPYLSTARYKYLSFPATLIYVSSILQLSQTCYFRLCIFASIIWTKLKHPSLNSWVVHSHTSYPQNFFYISITQSKSQFKVYGLKNYWLWISVTIIHDHSLGERI